MLRMRLWSGVTDSPSGGRLEDMQQDPSGRLPRRTQLVGLVPPSRPRRQLAHLRYVPMLFPTHMAQHFFK